MRPIVSAPLDFIAVTAVMAAAVLLGASACSDPPPADIAEPARVADTKTPEPTPNADATSPTEPEETPSSPKETKPKGEPDDDQTVTADPGSKEPKDNEDDGGDEGDGGDGGGDGSEAKGGDESDTGPPEPPEPKEGESEEHTFIRYYFDLVTYAQRTGDTAPMEELSGKDCASCQSVRKSITELHDAGGQRDVVWAVDEIRDQDDPTSFLVAIQFAEHDYVPSKGAKPTPQEAEPYIIALKLAANGDSWVVEGFVRVDG